MGIESIPDEDTKECVNRGGQDSKPNHL